MSLMDAMLLEGYRDPREVYIALRTDGLKGSGTIDDPFDGGVREGAASLNNLLLNRKTFLVLTGGAQHHYVPGQTTIQIAGDTFGNFNGSYPTFEALTATCFKITMASVPGAAPRLGNSVTAVGSENSFAATLSYSGTQITVTKAAHNYSTGDKVEIAGITNTNDDWVNGTFSITYLNANQFRYENTNSSGPIAPTAPAQGSPTCKRIFAPIAVRLVWPVVKMTAAQATGYSEVEIVRLQGTGNPSFEGDRQIIGVNGLDYWFEAMPDPASDASLSSVTARKLQYRFDDAMRSLDDGAVVRIGAGVFETRGYDPYRTLVVNWAVRGGQSIRGSGVGVTTLKLAHVSPYWPNPQVTFAVGHGAFSPPFNKNVDDAEVSDLTVDCNLRSHADRFVATAAVALRGGHVRIRRVRAIDYGTHVPGLECFVFAVGQADPRTGFSERVNMRIEDCIMEQPSLNGLYTNTCMILSSGEDNASSSPTFGIKAYHRGSVIRRNYVNNEYVDSPVSIASIQYEFGAWVVRTNGPHGRVNDQWVVISGAVDSSGTADTEGYSVHFNGSFKISGVSGTASTAFQITPAGSPATTFVPKGDMWVGRFNSHRISVKKVELVSSSPPVAKLTSHIPHNRKPGQWVYLSSVTYPPNSSTAQYWGRFKVLEDGMTPTELKYELDQVPVASCASDQSGSGCVSETIFMGVNSVAYSTDGGSEAVAEGNKVFRSSVGGSYHDTWSTKDQTDRDNYASDVLAGPQQNLGGIGYLRTAKNVSASGSTVTIETFHSHGLAKGQAVFIDPALDTTEKKFFLVTSVPSDNDKLFTVEAVGTINLAPTYQFANMFQVRLAIRANNVIELGQVSPLSRGWGPPTGIVFYSGVPHDDQYVFQRVIIEDNIVGLLPGSANYRADAVELRQVEAGLIRGNVLDVINSVPVVMGSNKPLHFSGNMKWSGVTVRPQTGTDGIDLETKIQDALMLSL